MDETMKKSLDVDISTANSQRELKRNQKYVDASFT
jgi:hypothetical protein